MTEKSEDDLVRLTPEEALNTSGAEGAATVARALASLIPLIGGPAVELINSIVQPNLSKRRDKFLMDLYNDLRKLEEQVKGFSVEALVENDQFVSVLVRVGQAAQREHHKEKLEALRNAALNTAVGTTLTEDAQFIFVRLIEELTPTHLRVLGFFGDPQGWRVRHKLPPLSRAAGAMTPRDLMEKVMPGFQNSHPRTTTREFYAQVLKDLNDRGLAPLGMQEINIMLNDNGPDEPHITGRGKEFLEYISSPLHQ